MILLVIACGSGVVAAVTGAAMSPSGLEFLPQGHWVYNSVLQAAFHLDGATANIDAQAQVPGEAGSQVVQGDSSGFVVGRSRITEFGKSTLSVEATSTPPSAEVPYPLEIPGGPYLVYRDVGQIVRLGDPGATIAAGGPLGDPVATADGTLWLFRTTAGLLCSLPRGADRITSCPVAVPQRHTGALTMVRDKPRFVDTTDGTLHAVGAEGLGGAVPLGVATSPQSRPAANDVAGKVAIFDRATHQLHLVDPGTPAAKPVTVPLPAGDYDGPASTGSAVAMVNRGNGTVVTFDATGKQTDAKPIPRDSGGEPRLTRGADSRLYVEGGQGTHVLVVDHDGKVSDVPVAPAEGKPGEQPGTPPGDRPGPPVEQQATDPRPPDGRRNPANPVPAGTTGQDPKPPQKPKPQPQGPAIPAAPPGAPPAVSAAPGNGSVTVSWGAAPDNRAPVTAYHVSWTSSGGSGSTTVGGDSRRTTLTGLTNGTRYTVTVAATNKAGTGPGASAAPVTPAAAASAPAVTVTHSGGTATVRWNQPDLGGGTLQHYLVSGTGAAEQKVTGTSTTFSGLTAGKTYTYTVRAVTSAGGQTLTGAAGSKSITLPARSITISRGRDTTSDNCHAPNCAFVNVSMKGFAPNTTYKLRLSSDDNPDVNNNESATTGPDGSAQYNELNYDVPGNSVWVSVSTPEGTVTSNKIRWE